EETFLNYEALQYYADGQDPDNKTGLFITIKQSDADKQAVPSHGKVTKVTVYIATSDDGSHNSGKFQKSYPVRDKHYVDSAGITYIVA
ncbi:hypothetical protein KKI93_25810, partial [Xenorhabdus bovienii]|uniref:hypothetical protein n=1 Tax=Xenorhabdus bovienii TaxID=40576 RepID=UPI0023B219F3